MKETVLFQKNVWRVEIAAKKTELNSEMKKARTKMVQLRMILNGKEMDSIEKEYEAAEKGCEKALEELELELSALLPEE